jgi:hypothetical protein
MKPAGSTSPARPKASTNAKSSSRRARNAATGGNATQLKADLAICGSHHRLRLMSGRRAQYPPRR